VTGAVSEEFAVNSLKHGADDYVLKTNLSRLPTAIQYAIRQRQYESNRVQQEELLREQNEELVKINKELDAFVYSVSHNLRSPLTSVLGLVNVAKLDGNKSPETVDHYFEMIQGCILKLDKTLQEILDYSRNTRTELEIGKVDLEKLISECFEQVKYLKGYAEIIQQVEVQRDTLFYSDAHRLSIIFNNLISNAIQFRDKSKNMQVLKIIAHVSPELATIIVRDNGIGIAPNHLPFVFKMFFRGTDKSDGAGLGLYIVKEMIGKLNGTITITSIPYMETEITVVIPINWKRIKKTSSANESLQKCYYPWRDSTKIQGKLLDLRP
jgi:signal transduction histidine kinase